MANNKSNGKKNMKTKNNPSNGKINTKAQNNSSNSKKNTGKKMQNLEETNALDIIIDDERLTDKNSLDVSFIDGKGKKKKAAKAIEKLEQDVNYEIEEEELEKPEKKKSEFLSTLFIILFSLILGFLICYIWGKETDAFIVKEKIVEKEVIIDDNYVFVGDSIFEGYDLDKYYENMPVVNSGISGNTTENILKDMENRIYRYNPSKVFLMIGTNDCIYDISSEETIENVGEIIDGIKKNRPYAEIYVQSIYPVNRTDDDKINLGSVKNRNNDDIKLMNSGIKKLCEEKDVNYMNIYDSLIDEEGNLAIDYTKEGLHISDEGYKVITTEVMKILGKK